MLEKILAIGSGVGVYKLLDKYVDPNYPMPWKAQVPQVEASNTLGFVDFLVAWLVARYGGVATYWKERILEHGIGALVSSLWGLAFTPALYVISGPPYVPGVTSPAVSPTVYTTAPSAESRIVVSGAF